MGLFGGGFGTLLGGVAGALTGGLAYPVIGAAVDAYAGNKAQKKATNRAYNHNITEAQKDREQQLNFAKNAISWRVKDAKNSGLHPLAALGAAPISASPAAIGVNSDPNMGQNLDPNIFRSLTKQGQKYDSAFKNLQLENMDLQNDLLRTQITSLKNNNTNPPAPPVDQSSEANTVGVETQNVTRNASFPGMAHLEAGDLPSVKLSRLPGGNLGVYPSEQQKQLLEDDIALETAWKAQIMAAVAQGKLVPPLSYLPKGKGYNAWKFNPITLSFEPIRQRSKKPSLKSNPITRKQWRHGRR